MCSLSDTQLRGTSPVPSAAFWATRVILSKRCPERSREWGEEEEGFLDQPRSCCQNLH